MTAAGSSFLRGWKRSMYSGVQNSIERLFWAGNQGNHQNFEKNDTSYETQGYFHWKKNKNKIKMAKWSKLIKLKKILAHHFRAPGEVVMRQHDSSLGLVGARGV